MALANHEVKEAYRDASAIELLAAEITCFRGIGDTQAELLQKYFSIRTVQDLARLSFFLQALAIMETVAFGNHARGTPSGEIAQMRDSGFQLTKKALGIPIEQLAEASLSVLEGLTARQNLALYDAFRVTNLRQLARNPIMLEARSVEFVQHQGWALGGESHMVIRAVLSQARLAGGIPRHLIVRVADLRKRMAVTPAARYVAEQEAHRASREDPHSHIQVTGQVSENLFEDAGRAQRIGGKQEDMIKVQVAGEEKNALAFQDSQDTVPQIGVGAIQGMEMEMAESKSQQGQAMEIGSPQEEGTYGLPSPQGQGMQIGGALAADSKDSGASTTPLAYQAPPPATVRPSRESLQDRIASVREQAHSPATVRPSRENPQDRIASVREQTPTSAQRGESRGRESKSATIANRVLGARAGAQPGGRKDLTSRTMRHYAERIIESRPGSSKSTSRTSSQAPRSSTSSTDRLLGTRIGAANQASQRSLPSRPTLARTLPSRGPVRTSVSPASARRTEISASEAIASGPRNSHLLEVRQRNLSKRQIGSTRQAQRSPYARAPSPKELASIGEGADNERGWFSRWIPLYVALGLGAIAFGVWSILRPPPPLPLPLVLPPTFPDPQTYRVSEGESLWRISQRLYDDGYRWERIHQANPQINNPNLIYPGQTLHIFRINGAGTQDTGVPAQGTEQESNLQEAQDAPAQDFTAPAAEESEAPR